jgi:hypothetical protein
MDGLNGSVGRTEKRGDLKRRPQPQQQPRQRRDPGVREGVCVGGRERDCGRESVALVRVLPFATYRAGQRWRGLTYRRAYDRWPTNRAFVRLSVSLRVSRKQMAIRFPDYSMRWGLNEVVRNTGAEVLANAGPIDYQKE